MWILWPANVNKWPQINLVLPVIHVLTIFDSTSRMFGIGEKTALNIGANESVIKVGDKVKSMDKITAEVAELSQTEKSFVVLQMKQILNKSIS